MTHMGKHFGVPSSVISYLPAAYGIAYGGVALLAGPLSDRLGRVILLKCGLLGFALLSSLIPLMSSLMAAIGLSALMGLCAAIIQPNSLALVADLSIPEKTGANIGRAFIGLMLAFVITPAISGNLAETFGWEFAYYFLSLLAIGTLCIVSMCFRSKSLRSLSFVFDNQTSLLTMHNAALSIPDVRWRLCASYLWLGCVAGFGAVVAEVASRKLAVPSTHVGLLAGFFGLTVIAGSLASGLLQRLLGKFSLPVMALVSALGLLLFLLPLSSPIQLALAGIPWAFGYGCGGPLHHAQLSALSQQYRGTINSYHASLINLGIFSVAALMGALALTSSLTLFCTVVSTIALAGATLLWRKIIHLQSSARSV